MQAGWNFKTLNDRLSKPFKLWDLKDARASRVERRATQQDRRVRDQRESEINYGISRIYCTIELHHKYACSDGKRNDSKGMTEYANAWEIAFLIGSQLDSAGAVPDHDPQPMDLRRSHAPPEIRRAQPQSDAPPPIASSAAGDWKRRRRCSDHSSLQPVPADPDEGQEEQQRQQPQPELRWEEDGSFAASGFHDPFHHDWPHWPSPAPAPRTPAPSLDARPTPRPAPHHDPHLAPGPAAPPWSAVTRRDPL